jgi:hypothetical protein
MPLTERDKRTLKIGGIVVGVLLLGFLIFNVLAGGGDEDALPDVGTAPTDVVPPPDGSPSSTPSIAPTQVAVFTGRDPFSVPPILSPAVTGGTTTSPGTTSPGTSPGTTSPGTTSPGTTSPPPPGDGSGTNQGGDTIVLLDVFTVNGEQRAQVEVNGQVYDVAVGDTFGPGNRYRLRSVAGNCATFVRGDEAFTLCTSDNK